MLEAVEYRRRRIAVRLRGRAAERDGALPTQAALVESKSVHRTRRAEGHAAPDGKPAARRRRRGSLTRGDAHL